MDFAETQAGWEQDRLTHDVVETCKNAAMLLKSPDITWHGIIIDEEGQPFEDSRVLHAAFPLRQDQEPVDITQIGKLNLSATYDVFNSWTIIHGEPMEEGGTLFRQFVITDKELTGVRHVVFHKQEDEAEQEVLKDDFVRGLAENAERGIEEGIDQPLPDDVLRLTAALASLKIYSKEVFRPHFMEERQKQTPEERRAELAMKYAVDLPEEYKTKRYKYWLIDTGTGVLYAVKAKTPDVAAAIVEEHTGVGLGFFWFEPVEEELVKKYDQFMSDEKEVARIIPYSDEPWPDDPKNMTDAQKAAFDRLRE